MNGRAYYNEHDPFAAAWLRNLIAAGHIAPGEVDTRSIVDVRSDDLAGFVQCHFFAGIAGWSLALRLADWPDDRPIWTGSCPCQPFSAAGRREGFADERHLWPVLRGLVAKCRPPSFFGEQVARAADWLALVRGDLEALGYAVGAMPVEAASAGAFHLRDRFWFVADAGRERCDGEPPRLRRTSEARRDTPDYAEVTRGGETVVLANADVQHEGSAGYDAARTRDAGRRREAVVMGNTGGPRLEGRNARPMGDECPPAQRAGEAVIWLPCRDGKARPTQSGIQPLAHGVPNRVGMLRAAGNAIYVPLAAEFIQAVMEAP